MVVLWENVLQTSHEFKITCSNNNIFVYENIMSHICINTHVYC